MSYASVSRTPMGIISEVFCPPSSSCSLCFSAGITQVLTPQCVTGTLFGLLAECLNGGGRNTFGCREGDILAPGSLAFDRNDLRS